MRDEVDDDLSVTGGLENRAFGFQARANAGGVHQVAVVRDGDLAVRAVDQDRLGVLQAALAGGRIARVPDGDVPGQGLERAFVEGVTLTGVKG